jgi:hypothetical protein
MHRPATPGKGKQAAPGSGSGRRVFPRRFPKSNPCALAKPKPEGGAKPLRRQAIIDIRRRLEHRRSRVLRFRREYKTSGAVKMNMQTARIWRVLINFSEAIAKLHICAILRK